MPLLHTSSAREPQARLPLIRPAAPHCSRRSSFARQPRLRQRSSTNVSGQGTRFTRRRGRSSRKQGALSRRMKRRPAEPRTRSTGRGSAGQCTKSNSRRPDQRLGRKPAALRPRRCRQPILLLTQRSLRRLSTQSRLPAGAGNRRRLRLRRPQGKPRRPINCPSRGWRRAGWSERFVCWRAWCGVACVCTGLWPGPRSRVGPSWRPAWAAWRGGSVCGAGFGCSWPAGWRHRWRLGC